MQAAEGGEMRIGALLGRSIGAAVVSMRLPRIGEIVYQGLPLAGAVLADGSLKLVPSPVSGVVTAVNSTLAEHPAALLELSLRSNWIATVSPTRPDEELARCRPRRVLLLNRDAESARQQSEVLAALGCQVAVSGDWNERLLGSQDPSFALVVIDAASFGDRGPELVEQITASNPGTRVVVSAEDSRWESAYRRRGIFYYALEPSADDEVVEILDAAFRQPHGKPVKPETSHGTPALISKISVTNRNRTKVCLLVEAGLLQKDHGLGQQIARGLLDRLFPVEVTLGSGGVTPIRVLKAAGAYQRVVVLLARDSGRLPGTLVQQKGDLVHVAGPDAKRVTAFVVQPDLARTGPLRLDERTTAMLADHIVDFMAKA